jgi:hypothetical protein
MWPETPSLVPRLSGRAGSAVFVSTAYRSVAEGMLLPPLRSAFSVDDTEIVIIPTVD